MRGDSRLSECSTSVSGMSLVPTSGSSHHRILLDTQSVRGRSQRSQRSLHMGAGSSGVTVPGDSECRLSHTDLRFSAQQLSSVEQLLVEDIRDTAPEALTDDELLDAPGSDAKIDADAERLLQRLLCAVSVDDPRFRCKFLVCLDRRARCAEYLVRIDALSSPALYDSDDPPACVIEECVAGEALSQGYARVRLRGVAAAADWAEFLCPAGCLRRDKVQERFVELLAAAVAAVTASSPCSKVDDVDESRMCGVAGKVIDADVLPELLATPPDCQLFVGSSSATPFRQESIAIVEGCPWIRLHVGGVQLKLALAVTTERWPRGSTLPSRVSLAHPDCLLIQHACAGGCAAVAAGPPPSSSSGAGARATAWQIWVPSAAAVLKRHYSPRAAPRRVERALLAVRAVTRLRTVSRYAMRTLLWWHVEETATTEWSPRTATRHTLLVLDALVSALRQRHLRCYFFPSVNVLAASPRGTWRPAEQLDDVDYAWDADAVEGYLRRLLNASLVGVDGSTVTTWPGESPATSWQLVEEALESKWSVAVRAVTPGPATRSRRLAIRAVRRHSAPGSTATSQALGAETFLAPRQLDYVIAVMRGLLHARSLLLEGPSTQPWLGGFGDGADASDIADDIHFTSGSPAGDVACVVSCALQQARAHAAADMLGRRSTSASRHRRASADSSGRALKQFDVAARQLMDAVRRDRPSSSAIPDDRALVRGALRWLQCAQDRAPRALAAPLRTWLKALSVTTSTACWLLPQWSSARRRNRDEISALGAALRVIGDGTASPSAVIADAELKGWKWAAELKRMPPGTQAVASPFAGKVIRFPVGIPLVTATTDRRVRRKAFSTTGSSTMPASVAREFSALLNNGFRPETDLADNVRPQHCCLRESSPSSSLLASRRRAGVLRGIGDLAPALLRMQKFNLVHEAIASAALSEAQRAEVIDALHTAVRESRRLSAVARRRSKDSTLPEEVYRPKSALIVETPIARVSITAPSLPDADARLNEELRRLSIADSLMSTIRAWRTAALIADPVFPPGLYSLTMTAAEKNADDVDVDVDDQPVTRTELTYLELTDDKRLRLGKARDAITKL